MVESSMGSLVTAVFLCFIVWQANGNSCPYDSELTASSISSLYVFNQTLDEPYDHIFGGRTDGLECTWRIEAARDGKKIVRLNFTTFHILNNTSTQDGDCIKIYDGDSDYSADLLQELCNRMPEKVYNSSGRYLSVVFRQGDRAGRRWFTLNYTMTEDTDDDHVDRFWTTTFGRVLSFIILIAIFSFCSAIFKAWRKGSVSNACRRCRDNLEPCLKPLRRLGSHCTGLFKSQREPGTRGEGRERSRSESDTDISTISRVNGSQQGPNLSAIFTSQDSQRSRSLGGSNLGEPPPDYSTILSESNSSSSLERSDGVREGENGGVHSSAVSFPVSSVWRDSSTGDFAPPPPPPDDASAPPSYELQAPPSYDSLFSSTQA